MIRSARFQSPHGPDGARDIDEGNSVQRGRVKCPPLKLQKLSDDLFAKVWPGCR